MKKLITLFVVIIFAGLVVWQIFSFLTTSEIVIKVSPEVLATYTTVTVDNKILASTENQQYKANVKRGKHAIVISSVGFKTKELSTSTGFRDSQEVGVTLEKATVFDVASEITSALKNVEVKDPKFFGDNNSWIVFFSSPKNIQADGLLVVAHYSYSERKWEVVEEGTDIEIDYLASVAPAELVNYVKGLL